MQFDTIIGQPINCVFQVTLTFIIGMVGKKYFYFIKKIHGETIWLNWENPSKGFKGANKLDTVW